MNLSKSKLSVAIAIGIGILGGSTQAFACVVSPDSILTEGETLQLVADCTGADGTNTVQAINWNMAVGAGSPVSITGDVLLRQPKPKRIYLTTPIGLTANGTGEYTFSVTGTYTDGTPSIDTDNPTFTTLEPAKVIVKPASVAVALALGTNSVSPVDASCGTADGTVVPAMPTGTAQCSPGKGALAISGPSYFTWTCLSTTGGAEDNCYATREGYVAPVAPTTTYGTCGTSSGQTLSVKPSTNLCNTTTTTPVVATGSTAYTWTCTGSNSAVTSDDASCSASIATAGTPPPVYSGSGDPGSGLWIPPNTTNLLIADQSGPNATYLSSYVPGCLNGSYINSSWNTGCGASSSFTGTAAGTSTTTTFSFGAGRVLGLRYMSKSTAGTALRYFTFASADGGNSGSMSVWLSDSPTATYAGTPNTCKSTSTTQPYVITGPGYCSITANKRYYLFMSTTRTDTNLRYLVNEGTADFY